MSKNLWDVMLVRRLIDLVLYSNLWIALGAMSMVCQTQYLLGEVGGMTNLSMFVFFSTVFVYGIHRFIGVRHFMPDLLTERSLVLTKFAGTMSLITGVSAIGSIFYFMRLDTPTKVMILVPTILSLLYILPILKGRRLRDLPFIKIFIISAVWAWATVFAPYYGARGMCPETVLLTLEKAAFIMGITIPFDIRDLRADQVLGVRTIPGLMGSKRSRHLASMFLLLAALLSFAGQYMDAYTSGQWMAVLLSYGISFPLVFYTRESCHDYYFSGLLDGLILLQFGFVWAVTT